MPGNSFREGRSIQDVELKRSNYKQVLINLLTTQNNLESFVLNEAGVSILEIIIIVQKQCFMYNEIVTIKYTKFLVQLLFMVQQNYGLKLTSLPSYDLISHWK